MAVLKCKMCGGELAAMDNSNICVCDYCGTKQTIPSNRDEILSNLFNRANNLRLRSEFDKAQELYEKIVAENPAEAEAYWGIVLCKYGIEYVEDPKTGTRIPTCHRTQLGSILADGDYKSAITNADAEQKSVYKDEAAKIDEIQKDILKIVHNEKPFDVFICYKETDDSGKRTVDSSIANDIYHQLTQEGFKVFYAAITLEDKLGQEYEPYIFAALNSAKTMLVLGTKPEYFTAVWVRNEWSRFMKLMQNDRSKLLIPCYRDMDAYDLPEEFAHLQAQDMGKIGFINDIVRGIKKVVDEPKSEKETVVVNEGNANIVALKKRGFMALEDGEWDKADGYFDDALNIDAEDAECYLGKLMAELQVGKKEGLRNCKEPFENSNNYQKVVRFGNDSIKNELSECIKFIKDRNENARLSGIYNGAVSAMNAAATESAYKAAAGTFRSISGFQDADALAEQCLDKAEVCRKDAIYASARREQIKNSIAGCESAIKLYESISGWKDADEQIYACQQKIEEIKAEEEADRLEAERQAEEMRIAAEKRKKLTIKVIKIVTPVIFAIIAFVIVLNTVIIPKQKLNKAMGLLDSGDYEAAYALLEEIGNSDAIASSKYDRAVALIEAGDYEAAYMLLNGLEYKDSAEKANEIFGKYKIEKLKTPAVGDIVYFGAYEQDNNTSNGKEDIEWLVLAKEGDKVLVISKYALDCQQYNTSRTDVTWETCSLRKWLNETFLSVAFSSEEQSSIISSTVTADKNPSHSTSPGNNTTDKVFLLSITEVTKYFSSDEARKCAPTDYAIAQGAWTSGSYSTGGKATCWWWLRSPGSNSNDAADVNYDGYVRDIGYGVIDDSGAVRPALWISLE